MVMKTKEESFYYCTECSGNIIFIPEIGETVCSQCGLVIDERGIDMSHSDKRAYTKEEHISREQVGPLLNPLTPAMGLHTVLPKDKIISRDLKLFKKTRGLSLR